MFVYSARAHPLGIYSENLFSLEETVRGGGRLYGSCILRSARRVPGACQL